jgi:hypothetical protein
VARVVASSFVPTMRVRNSRVPLAWALAMWARHRWRDDITRITDRIAVTPTHSREKSWRDQNEKAMNAVMPTAMAVRIRRNSSMGFS